jgi:hypothetical protein
MEIYRASNIAWISIKVCIFIRKTKADILNNWHEVSYSERAGGLALGFAACIL